jgi:hypothetical protein
MDVASARSSAPADWSQNDQIATMGIHLLAARTGLAGDDFARF